MRLTTSSSIRLTRLDIPRLALFWGLLAGFGEGAIYYSRGIWSPLAPDILRSTVVFEPLIFLAVGLIGLLAGVPTRGGLMRFHFVVSWCALFAWIRVAFPLQKPVPAGLEAVPIALLITLFLSTAMVVVSRNATWPLAGVAVCVALILPIREGMHERHEVKRLRAASPGAPNVVLVIVDTLRADHLSTYGYARPTSPFLTRLASQGVVFDNAIAPSSWTLPSHASMLTGLYPHEHHADNERTYLSYSIHTVGEAFEQAGYRTGVFSANTSFFGRRVGFGRGFIHFEDDFECWAGMLGQTYWGARIYEQIYHIGLDRDVLGRRHAADINRNFLRWISYSQRPFFSVLNYFDVHDPYLPPEPYRHQYSKVKNPGWYSSRSWVADLTPEQRQTAVDAYDGAINYVDAQLEALFAELQKRGLDKNTIVLVTSDHGESFGEHGFSNHGNALYRELIRVPLVVWAPGRVPSGKRVPRPVSLVELPATLVDLAGVHSPLAFRGPSMARLWGEGLPPALEPPMSELAELKWNPKFPNYYGPMVSITTADWHYISGGKDRVELYHCCESDVEQMDLAQTALGGPIARILSSELVAEGGWDPVSGVPPREFRYTAERAPDALSIADVNDDGNPDIAVAERGGGAIVLLGDGTGRFSPAPPEMNARARFGHAGLEARADLNGNGTEDIALADRAHRTIRFYFRRPDGRMATSTLPLDVSPDFIALADVNHNGLPDLVIASREKNSIIVLLSGPAAPARHVAELAGK